MLFAKYAVRIGRVLLLDILLQLIAAAGVLGSGNDLVIDAGDNLFDHRIGRNNRGQQQAANNHRQQGELYSLHRKLAWTLGTTLKVNIDLDLFYSREVGCG